MSVSKKIRFFVMVPFVVSLMFVIALFYRVTFTDQVTNSNFRSIGKSGGVIADRTKLETLFSADLPNDLDLFDFDQLKGKTSQNTVDGNLVVSGPFVLTGKNFIVIDTDKIYSMRVRMKLGNGAIRQPANVYIGFATYDENKNLELENPGSHRYFVLANNIANDALTDEKGWFTFEGTITGIAAETNAFRPTTKFAKPVLVLNYKAYKQSIILDTVSVAKVH